MRKFEFTKSTHDCGKTTSRFRGAILAFVLLLLAGWGNGALAQCALVCNDNVNVSLPGPSDNCDLEIMVDMVLEDPTSCNNPMEVTLMTLQGLPLPTSPTVNASHIGQTFIYSVSDGANSCWGTLKVEDKLGPEITNCNDVYLPCLADYRPTIDGGNAPTPNFADCSQIINKSYSDVFSHYNCSSPGVPFTAIILRTWTATDKFGNISTCMQYINMRRVSLTEYTPVCPTNKDYECSSGVAQNTSPAVTGYPTINIMGTVYPVIPGANNFCEIAASYADEVFNICGGGKKILRTWTIYDWCISTTPGSNNPWSCIQVIKVHDTTAPTVVCPAPIVHSASSAACKASLNLPQANITDACSNWTTKVLTPWGVVTGNGGLILDVPVGTHNISYVATDACGNVGSCQTTLTIKDDTKPVAVCDEFTTVSLTSDGTAIVSAATFDDGSSDNCAVDHFEVRRMASACRPATNFDTYTTFECCDIGANIMVVFRVFDQSGNYNDCMVEVSVQDKIDPTIVCPLNKTVECSDPLPAVAAPTVFDNCPGATWTHTEVQNLSACGIGTVTRNYKATDASGRMAFCTQIITVINSNPFNINDIIWPLDYYTEECSPSLEPTDLPPGYDFPTIFEDACDLIAVAHTDQLLPTNPPACYKILRKWIVIDWCRYNPNNPSAGGSWEHVQVIKVQDNTPPTLTCPGNTVVSSTDLNCAFGYVTLDAATATDCSNQFKWTTKVDYYSNGSIDAVGTNPNLSGSYPFGKHTATITVEDFCGNFSTCTFTIEVVDGKKPTPVCVNGIAAELMNDPAGNGGMVALTPQMFNAGSYDNCTSPANLRLDLTPSVFTCDDVGTNVVIMYVTDEAGNQDFCETYVIIQDNMVNCPAPLTADINGTVANPAGSGVQNVTVEVSGNGPLTNPVTTAQNGHYQFIDLTLGHDYTVTPSLNQNPLNGVTTFDLVLMTRHILQLQLLDSPYKIIAADVNKSGSVTTADMVELRKLILQIVPAFPNNTSWRFVDKNYVFPHPMNPFSPTFPEFFNVNNLSGDLNNVNFTAVKIGDVNGSASTNFNDPAADRNRKGSLALVVEDQPVVAGETLKVAFKAKNFLNLLGFQFALRFDPNALQLEDVQPGDLTNLTTANFGLTMLDEGTITASWDNSKNTLYDDNTILFSLVFKANANATLSDLLQLNTQSAVLPEAYQSAGDGEMQLLDLNLQFINPLVETETEFELYQNNPNPFREQTAIGFRLPESGKATLTVYDLSGKIITAVSDVFQRGYNEIILQQKDLGTSGILFYQLETPGHTATRRMVRL